MPPRKAASEDGEPLFRGSDSVRIDGRGEIGDIGDSHARRRFSGKGMRLEKIVEYPTWREMLLDLVEQNELDPWNIDIVQVTGSYIESIRKMEMLDLRIPANLILAAAILIRFKSDALRFEEEAQVPTEETYVPEEGGEPETIPMLELKTRIPPKRMVTLDELLLAMDKVFEEQRKREERASRVEIPAVINIQLPEFNIEQRMEEVYSRVLHEKDSEGLATFSSILRSRDGHEAITTLLPLLHLVQDRRLSIFQERFFGEIFIRVRDPKKKREKDEKIGELDESEAEEIRSSGEDAQDEEEIRSSGGDAGEGEEKEQTRALRLLSPEWRNRRGEAGKETPKKGGRK